MRYGPVYILLLLGTLLHAQQDTPRQPASRWLTTVGVSMDLGDYQSRESAAAGNDDRGGHTARNLFVSHHYRLHRSFDLGLIAGHLNSYGSGFRSVIDVSSGLVAEINWNSRRRNTYLGLQPRLNYRIGQGDLSLALAAGIVRHRNTTQLNSPTLGRANQASEPLLANFLDARLGYTYWVSTTFGVEVSLAYHDLRLQDNTGGTDEDGNYIFTPLDFIDRTEALDASQLTFPVQDFRRLFPGIALVHHW